MSPNSEAGAAPQFSEEQLKTMVEGFFQGASVGAVCNVQQEQLEAGYALAYNLYTAGSYADAETMFRALCLYDHNDERYWMGLAGCRQALGQHAAAIDAYGMAGMASALSDPTPFVHAGLCYMKLGDKENARATFAGVEVMGDPANEAHAVMHRKAKAMLDLLAGEGA